MNISAIFTIDAENTITAHPVGQPIPIDETPFASEQELATIASDWPTSRLVAIWNAFAGAPPFCDLEPIKKFTDRKTGVVRIWRAIQALVPEAAPTLAPVAPAPKRATTKPKTKDEPREARPDSKKAIVLDLLRRPEGATLDDLMARTGWQIHSVRGFISTIGKKMGVEIESFMQDHGPTEGLKRAYRIR